jgi:SAM-dependent methyltransferase
VTSPRRGDGFLPEIYRERFSATEADEKDAIWKEITRFLARFVPADGAVLDLACDRGDFIRNIPCREKWATDLRDMSGALSADITFIQADGLDLDDVLPQQHFDVVFMSNYLEHLATNNDVIEQFRVVHRLLRPNGRVIVLQPNIKLVGGDYWDFIDHSVALTEKSLEEAAVLGGFRTDTVIRRFLPYTTKSRFPKGARLVRAYLAIPVLWRILGKQTLYIGAPAPEAAPQAPH